MRKIIQGALCATVLSVTLSSEASAAVMGGREFMPGEPAGNFMVVVMQPDPTAYEEQCNKYIQLNPTSEMTLDKCYAQIQQIIADIKQADEGRLRSGTHSGAVQSMSVMSPLSMSTVRSAPQQ